MNKKFKIGDEVRVVASIEEMEAIGIIAGPAKKIKGTVGKIIGVWRDSMWLVKFGPTIDDDWYMQTRHLVLAKEGSHPIKHKHVEVTKRMATAQDLLHDYKSIAHQVKLFLGYVPANIEASLNLVVAYEVQKQMKD